MAGIFPTSGVPWNQATNAEDIDTTNCPDGALFHNTSRCNPRFDAEAANALISEIGNAVNDAGLDYDCERLDNLSAAIQAMVDQASPCGAPAATPAQLSQITSASPLVTCVDGDVVSFPISHVLPTTGATTTPCNATTLSAGQLNALIANPALMFLLFCFTGTGGPILRRLHGNHLRQILLGDLIGFLDNEVRVVTQRNLTPSYNVGVPHPASITVNAAGRLAVGIYRQTVETSAPPPFPAYFMHDFPRSCDAVAFVDVAAGDVIDVQQLAGPARVRVRVNGSTVIEAQYPGFGAAPSTINYTPPAAEAARTVHFVPCFSRRASDGRSYDTHVHDYTQFGALHVHAFAYVWRVS